VFSWGDFLKLLVGVVALGGIAGILIYSAQRRRNIRDATGSVFEEWWGDELSQVRVFFFEEFCFLPLVRNGTQVPFRCLMRALDADYATKGMSTRIRTLCSFFDKVGWLAAAALIDVDDVLGPMQETVRLVWRVLGTSVVAGREEPPRADTGPVLFYGMEWLYKRSLSSTERSAVYGSGDPEQRHETEWRAFWVRAGLRLAGTVPGSRADKGQAALVFSRFANPSMEPLSRLRARVARVEGLFPVGSDDPCVAQCRGGCRRVGEVGAG
jgi:hypothetical protein